MDTSAFGVEDSRISKVDAQGTDEHTLGMDHEKGMHEGKSFRRCPKCGNSWGAVRKPVAEVGEAARMARRAV